MLKVFGPKSKKEKFSSLYNNLLSPKQMQLSMSLSIATKKAVVRFNFGHAVVIPLSN